MTTASTLPKPAFLHPASSSPVPVAELVRKVKGQRTVLHTAHAKNLVTGMADCVREYERRFPGKPWADAAYTGEFVVGIGFRRVYTLRPAEQVAPRVTTPRLLRNTYVCHNCHAEVPKTSYVCQECGRDVS